MAATAARQPMTMRAMAQPSRPSGSEGGLLDTADARFETGLEEGARREVLLERGRLVLVVFHDDDDDIGINNMDDNDVRD